MFRRYKICGIFEVIFIFEMYEHKLWRDSFYGNVGKLCQKLTFKLKFHNKFLNPKLFYLKHSKTYVIATGFEPATT